MGPAPMASYTILDHTADTGVEAAADTLAQLTAHLATGMFELMARIEPCPADQAVEMEVSAGSDEDLVFEALSELLYQSETEDLLFCGFDVMANDAGANEERSMRITARGVLSTDVEMTGPPIKAVTYHDMRVTKTDDGWYGRVYFDV